jgi:hypothetical protein
VSAVLGYYAAAQLTLLPIFLLYLWVVPGRAGLRFQWVLHRILLVASLLLPFVFAIPLHRFLPPTQHAFDGILALFPEHGTGSLAAIARIISALPLLFSCLSAAAC